MKQNIKKIQKEIKLFLEMCFSNFFVFCQKKNSEKTPKIVFKFLILKKNEILQKCPKWTNQTIRENNTANNPKTIGLLGNASNSLKKKTKSVQQLHFFEKGKVILEDLKIESDFKNIQKINQ